MTSRTNKTLAEHMRITDAEVAERKALLEFTPDLEQELGGFRTTAIDIAASIVAELYAHQVTVPAIEEIIGDKDTLTRLKNKMQTYIVELFGGQYGLDYVNSRLLIGKVHARIGVKPHHYLNSISRLQSILTTRAIQNGGTPKLIKALHKILLLDTQFVIDTYVIGLLTEVEHANNKLAQYADELEATVKRRTSEIERLARTDEVTGLGNRREFFRSLRNAIEDVQAFRRSLSLIFMDIDDFKATNDKLGHVEGDRILRSIGQAIMDATETPDTAFRFGGDEFCIITADANEESAIKHFERIAEKLPSGTSLSYGIATMQTGSSLTKKDLISLADQAMYFNKAQNKTLRRA